jgi:hypothetical protein
MDSLFIDLLVPVRPRIVITGMVDATYFEEESRRNAIGLDPDIVCSKNAKILLNNTLIRVIVLHGEGSLLPTFAEAIDLLAYRSMYILSVQSLARHVMAGSSERNRVPLVIFLTATRPLPLPGISRRVYIEFFSYHPGFSMAFAGLNAQDRTPRIPQRPERH